MMAFVTALLHVQKMTPVTRTVGRIRVQDLLAVRSEEYLETSPKPTIGGK